MTVPTGTRGSPPTGGSTLPSPFGVLTDAARDLARSWDGGPTDIPDRSAVEADLRRVLAEVEARARGGSSSADPPRTLHASRVLDLLRREFVRHWKEDPPREGPSLLEMLCAFEDVAESIEPAPEGLGGQLLDTYSQRILRELAHSVRSPLSSITFLSEVICSGHGGPVNEVQTRQLTIIYRAALTLGTLINDVLALTEPSHRTAHRDTPGTLLSVLDPIVDAVAPICEEKGVQLRVEGAEGAHWVGRPAILRRILFNLVLDGVLGAEVGPVILRIEQRGRVLRFVVSSAGGGAAERGGRIFLGERERDDYSICPEAMRMATVERLLSQLGSRPEVTRGPGGALEVGFDVPESDPPAPQAPGLHVTATGTPGSHATGSPGPRPGSGPSPLRAPAEEPSL